MPESPAERYRRLAQECLDVARTLSLRTKRAILIDMAQTWLQMAEEQEAAIPPSPVDQPQPIMQQQQQVQPKDDDKKE
jgi:hypothetical protein